MFQSEKKKHAWNTVSSHDVEFRQKTNNMMPHDGSHILTVSSDHSIIPMPSPPPMTFISFARLCVSGEGGAFDPKWGGGCLAQRGSGFRQGFGEWPLYVVF